MHHFASLMATRDGIPYNFRLLLPDQPNGAVLYRSSNPDLADEATVSRWIEQLGIRTIIDLRNPKEFLPYVEGDSASPLAIRFPLTSYDVAVSPARKPCDLARVNINATNTAYRVHMFRQFPWRSKAMIIYLLLKSLFTGDRSEVEVYGAQELFNRRTQADLYCSFIDFSQASIAEIFRVFCCENAFGVLINCNAGKDRTGIIAALVMDLLGYDRKQIVEEYHKSEAMLTDVQPELDAEFSSGGLDAEKFAYSPKRTMEETLEHIYSKYGGTGQYLKQLGFSEEDLKTIRNNLSSPTSH